MRRVLIIMHSVWIKKISLLLWINFHELKFLFFETVAFWPETLTANTVLLVFVPLIKYFLKLSQEFKT